jgi:NADH:ubiquinone oxidoreductase subunit 4 (subunit M)
MVYITLSVKRDIRVSFNVTHLSMLLILTASFFFKKIILFYVFFEISLLPISVMIIAWGYQPERLIAFIYILMYTIRGSLPLFMSLAIMLYVFNLDNF